MTSFLKKFAYNLAIRLSQELGYELIKNDSVNHFLVDKKQTFVLNLPEALEKRYLTSIMCELFAEKGYGENVQVYYASLKSAQLGKIDEEGLVQIICLQNLEELRIDPSHRPLIVRVPPEALRLIIL